MDADPGGLSIGGDKMGLKDLFKKKDGQDSAVKKPKEKDEAIDANELYRQLLEDYPEEEAKQMLDRIMSISEDAKDDEQ